MRQFRVKKEIGNLKFLGLSIGKLPDSSNDFLFPSCSPVDFEPEEAHKSIDKIVSLKPDRVFLTHGGLWEDVNSGAFQMHFAIQEYQNIMEKIINKIKHYETKNLPIDEFDLHDFAKVQMNQFFEEGLLAHGINNKEPFIWDLLKSDIELNSQGLVIAAKRYKDKKTNK